MKIGLITIEDPLNKRTWSGINFKIYEQLLRKNKNENIYLIGPLKKLYFNSILNIFSKIVFFLFKKKYEFGHSIILSKLYSIQVNWKLKHKYNHLDVILSVVSSPALSFIKTSIPIINFTDATFQSLVDYYAFNLLQLSIVESNYIEKSALRNTNFYIFPSDWALKDTVKNYNIEESLCRVIKMGPNFSLLPGHVTQRVVGRDKPFNILFVGVDWSRKGGDIILDAFLSLRKKGYDTLNLTICGSIPPHYDPTLITVHPFLDKNKDSDSKLLQDIYNESHVFVLPTRAECAGIVFAEAAAYSLPIISTDTGGVTSYVEDQYNGYTLNIMDDFTEYEKILVNLMTDQNLYNMLSENSYNKYKNELNWDYFGDGLFSILKEFDATN